VLKSKLITHSSAASVSSSLDCRRRDIQRSQVPASTEYAENER